MQGNQNLVSEMRRQVLKLYSAEIQSKFENEPDESKRKNFLSERKSYDNYLQKLERNNLQNVLAKMKPLEQELERAIKSLDNAVQRIDNTVNIIRNIRSISSIISRIVRIV